jgi:ABC-type lipoprotein release transport system permease subunit
VLRLGTSGLRTRPARAVLSALGIAIGIAAMVAVVGISASSHARLNQQLASLGTNMLTAEAGNTLTGEKSKLPPNTIAKVGLLEGVGLRTFRPSASIAVTSQTPPQQAASSLVPPMSGCSTSREQWSAPARG